MSAHSRTGRGLVLAGLLAAAGPLAAQDDVKPVAITADIGFVNTAGNSELTTLNLGEKIVYTQRRFKLTQTVGLVYGRVGDSTTASQWRGSVRGDYKFAGAVSFFARGAFERNTFAGIKRRFEESVGLGATVFDLPRTRLDVELGASLNQQTSLSDVTTTFAAGRAAADFKQFISATAFVTQALEVLPNLEETDDLRINSETALVAPISSQIAVKLTYTVRFDNLPEPGPPAFEKTDRIFTAGLQIVF